MALATVISVDEEVEHARLERAACHVMSGLVASPLRLILFRPARLAALARSYAAALLAEIDAQKDREADGG